METSTHVKGTWAVILLVSFFYSGPAQSQENYEVKIKEAAIGADWAKVAEISAELKRSDTSTAIVDWLAGYAGLATGDYKLATESFLQLGKPQTREQLVAWATECAGQNPRNAIALMFKGDALARVGRYEEAVVSLDEAVRLNPTSALLYNVCGVVRAFADKPDEAKSDFEKAVEIDPKFADPLANLGIIRLADGDFIGALEYLNRAIDVCPNFALALNARGVLYSNLKSWEQSEVDFQKAKELAPRLSFVSGNLNLLLWVKGQEQFRASRITADQNEGRGTTLVASAYDRYSVDIGDGRRVDVININNTPQTTTIGGMEATLRHITNEFRNEAKLPADWKPDVLFVQPGLGSSAYAERTNFAKMAFNAGKDFVVCIDMTDKFKWPDKSLDLRMLQIDEDVSRRFERGIVAANHVWQKAPDVVLESQATRMLLNGVSGGSVTIADLYARQSLHADFKLGKVMVIGVPMRNQAVNDGFRKNCISDIMAVTTPSLTAFIASEPLKGVSAVQVWMRDGQAPSHGLLFAEQWKNRQMNPIPDIAGLYLRGTAPSIIQDHANQLRNKVPMYTSFVTDPTTVHLSMASMTRRGLTNPDRDGVLIGCKDAKLGEVMKDQYGDSWRVKVVPETDSGKLQQLAYEGGFTRINIVADIVAQESRIGVSDDRTLSQPMTLPEIRSFAKDIDRYNTAVNLLYKLADRDIPPEIKFPLAFTSPIIQDMRAAQEGRYSLFTSQSLERVGQFGLKELPKIVDILKEQGKLSPSFNLPPAMAGLPDIAAGAASQIGRGKTVPSIPEVQHYLDGVSKASWATVGAMIAGPKGAAIASTSAGLTADVLREITQPVFDKWAQTPVRKQMMQDWRTYFEAATSHGVPVKSFSEMFGSQFIKQVGFNQGVVAELDNAAKIANIMHPVAQQQSQQQFRLPDQSIRNISLIVTPRQDEVWKKIWKNPSFPIFPPDKFGGAGVPSGSYRLPSNVMPDEKRGGVAMKADVVKGEKADTSEMFGGETSTVATSIQQEGLVCPFLIFCAMPSGGEIR